MLSRRHFLAALRALPALPALRAFAETKPVEDRRRRNLWQVRGHREALPGVDQQFQVNPLHYL